MSGREEMLERTRKALGAQGKAQGAIPQTLPTTRANLDGIMQPIAAEDLVPKFEMELQKLAGSTYRASNPLDLEKILRQILEASQATSVALSRNPLLGKMGLPEKLRAWGKSVSGWPAIGADAGQDDSRALRELAAKSFSATVGITGVDFVLAETGSLVLSSLAEGSQLASLAPPVHVALYRRGQVIGSLDEVLEKLPVSRDPNLPSRARSVVFITGPSRTADIEQILIRGVHGPREVHAILVEESCMV